MESYWNKGRAKATTSNTVLPTDTGTSSTDDGGSASGSASVLTDYHQYRLTILSSMEREGWEAELRCYEKDMPADVSPETDIIKWWQVCPYTFQQDIF